MSHADDSIALAKTKLSSLRDAGDFCDVIIQVSDTQNYAENYDVKFKAHKLILVAAIPYFYSLYADDQLKDFVALPPCVEPLTFSIILDFAYFHPLSPRLIHSKLTHDPAHSRLPLALVLEKLIATATFFGLDRLANRLTTWSKDTHPTQSLDHSLSVKHEVLDDDGINGGESDVKYRPIEFNGDASPPRAFDNDDNDHDVVIKRELNFLEEEAVNSKLVISVKRIDDDDDDVCDLKVENFDRCNGELSSSSAPVKRRKRRKKLFSLPKETVKRVRRDPSERKSWTPKTKRKVLSRDLIDSTMSVQNR